MSAAAAISSVRAAFGGELASVQVHGSSAPFAGAAAYLHIINKICIHTHCTNNESILIYELVSVISRVGRPAQAKLKTYRLLPLFLTAFLEAAFLTAFL